jgi:hypothetical protein
MQLATSPYKAEALVGVAGTTTVPVGREVHQYLAQAAAAAAVVSSQPRHRTAAQVAFLVILLAALLA